MQVTTIGLDIAKNVFQVHGIDAAEKVVVRKQLRRRQVLEFFKALPPCLVGMEACATAHYWARELTKLGHQVRLMPAKDVKAYVKRATLPFNCAEYYNSPKGRKTMRRRDFIAGLMIAAVTGRAQAQQTGKVYRIAFAHPRPRLPIKIRRARARSQSPPFSRSCYA
jgi:hypothetical protein